MFGPLGKFLRAVLILDLGGMIQNLGSVICENQCSINVARKKCSEDFQKSFISSELIV